MPLNSRQLVVAQSPYRALPEDLVMVMQILSDFEEQLVFGENRLAVVLEIQKAAVSRRIPIPYKFNQVLLKIQNSPGEGWSRRSEFELP